MLVKFMVYLLLFLFISYHNIDFMLNIHILLLFKRGLAADIEADIEADNAVIGHSSVISTQISREIQERVQNMNSPLVSFSK